MLRLPLEFGRPVAELGIIDTLAVVGWLEELFDGGIVNGAGPDGIDEVLIVLLPEAVVKETLPVPTLEPLSDVVFGSGYGGETVTDDSSEVVGPVPDIGNVSLDAGAVPVGPVAALAFDNG